MNWSVCVGRTVCCGPKASAVDTQINPAENVQEERVGAKAREIGKDRENERERGQERPWE
jgi:hypothetical protein